ncbi:MAG: hypothetical protein ACOCSF_02755 [Halanaeroarchaeum sp.]
MRGSVILGGVLTAALALVAWNEIGRTAIVPVGAVAGVIVGLASPQPGRSLLDGAKSGSLGALFFVAAVALVGAYRYRVVGVGFAVDWGLFTGFAMIIMVLPLYMIEGAVVAPVVQTIRAATRP